MLKKLVDRLLAWANPFKVPEGTLPKIDTLKELENFREVEAQTENLAKMLKCQPDEILTKINKILTYIEQLDLERRTLEARAAAEEKKPDEPAN